MSDKRIVESDKRFGARMLRAIIETEGMTAPEKANYWLEGISSRLHRGPRVDTWTSARDRAAEFAEIKPSMAARIWHRWREMKGVDGEALMNLMIAYEKLCAANEAAADNHRAERLALRGPYEADKESMQAGVGVGASADGEMAYQE